MSNISKLADAAFEVRPGVFEIDIPVWGRLRQAPCIEDARADAVSSALFESNRLGLCGLKITAIETGMKAGDLLWTWGSYTVTFYTEQADENRPD